MAKSNSTITEPLTDTNGLTIYKPPDTEFLPDKKGWTKRFEIPGRKDNYLHHRSEHQNRTLGV